MLNRQEPLALLAMTAESGGGMLLVSGPGQACLDALRCAAFLGQQHPQDLKQAILDHTTASPSRTTTEGGGQAGGLRWLEALVSLLQGVVGEAGARAGARRRRRKKRRRREQQGVEKEPGQAGEEQERWEEEEEVGSASEEEEEEEEEGSGGTWLGEGPAGGQRAAGQQVQQQGGSRQRPEERGGMQVDPAASVSTRPRADLVMGSSNSSSRRGGAVRRMAVAEVLSSGDVVGSIFSFVVGVGGESTGRQSVRQLGQLGLVCRKWREVSLWEAWWTDAAEEMLPVAVGGRGGGSGGVMDGRGRVLEHGRMVWCERRVWVGEEGWTRGLSIHFEMFDRMDGLQMLSARGPLDARYAGDGRYSVHVARGHRWEVAGRPFSAASRDPEQRRFQSMRDFFRRGHEAGFASSVCVRVSVMDERTGRRALLWEEEGEQGTRVVTDVQLIGQEMAGEHMFQVRRRGPCPVTCPLYSGPPLQGLALFVVSPAPGQGEGVSEQEKLYRLFAHDEQNQEQYGSAIQLDLSTRGDGMSLEAVMRFIRSVLGMGQV